MAKTESQTRKEIIDKRLAEAGWLVGDLTRVVEEFDITVHTSDRVREPQSPYHGHQFSDYVLLGKDGKPLAVVEAKKTSKDAELGREQAKQYTYHIKNEYNCDLPFCFYTNGHEIYFWDIEHYPPRKIFGFPTRDDLERFAYIRKHKKHLAYELINTDIAGRDYQVRSMANPVLQKIRKGEPVSDREAESLAAMLHNEHPHITVELPRRAYNNQKAHFLQFIRHILGIEILESFSESVSKAVDMFTQKHSNLSGRQMDFLQLLKSYIIERGTLEKRDLIEAPFTQLHPEGIRGIFSPREIEEILDMTKGLVA